MNDGSNASSYEQSEADSDRESALSYEISSSLHSEANVEIPQQGTDVEEEEEEEEERESQSPRQDISQDVNSESEVERKPRRPKRRRLADAEDEIARLQSGQRPKTSRYLANGYRNVLNSIIDHVNEGSGSELTPQFSSQIGASFWSSEEKECFFNALASRGRGNPRKIAECIGSKDEAEVQYYLGLLEDQAYCPAVATVISPAHIPAAHEISEDCERILEFAADTLARHADKHDIFTEQEISGERWLINEDVADEIEKQYEESYLPVLEGQTSGAANAPDTDLELSHTYDDQQLPRVQTAAEEDGISDSAELLLRPQAFLQLSKCLFMNRNDDEELNWSTMGTISNVSDSPAMFQTTLNDFYNLTLSLTRRLIRTSLFQATSRLRAEDGEHAGRVPHPVVREIDVRTAIYVLGMNSDRNHYWATAPRRCHVQVLSRASTYNDGRSALPNRSFLLSYDEVEGALGLKSAGIESTTSPDTVADESIHDVEIWEALDDDTLDILTEASSPSPPSTPHRSDFPGNDETNLYRAETRGLNAFDEQSSLKGEDKLWAALNLNPPQRTQPAAEVSVPSLTKLLDAGKSNHSERAWRNKVEYEAPWEGREPLVEEGEFRATEERGRKGRRRRERLYGMIRERLNEASDEGGRDVEGEEESEIGEEDSGEDEMVGKADSEEVLSDDHASDDSELLAAKTDDIEKEDEDDDSGSDGGRDHDGGSVLL